MNTLPLKNDRITRCGQRNGLSGTQGVSARRLEKLSVRGATKGRHQRGFTLIEMMLVLMILGVLAAIVVPKMANRGQDAKIKAAVTQISSFKTALDMFEVDNGYYPKGRNGLLDLVQKPRDASNWHGPYLERIPKDPWENDYIYEFPGKHNPNGFDIMSMGPDGRSGTEDDITSWEQGK